jgi:hypothetical protein
VRCSGILRQQSAQAQWEKDRRIHSHGGLSTSY